MSRHKQLTILAGIAGFLVVTLAIGILVRNGGFGGQATRTIVSNSIDAKNLAGFTISHGNKIIKLNKEGSAWFLQSGDDAFVVRESRVDDFVNSLKTISLGRVVTRGEESYAELKIGDSDSWKLELETQDKVKHPALYFGDSKGQEQYFRLAGSPDVHTIQSSLAFYLQQESKYWVDRRIWPDTDLKIVDSFTYQSKGAGQVVVAKKKDSGGWQIEAGDKPSIKKDQLATWVQAIAVLEADDVQIVSASVVPSGYKETIRLSSSSSDGSVRLIVFYAGQNKEEPWLAIPQFEKMPVTQKGHLIAFLVPEYKLQRGIIEP